MISIIKKLLERFTKKNCKRLIKKKFRIEKAMKKKGHELYVKWNCYDSSFNSWIGKKKLIKRMQFECIKMSKYLSKPFEPFPEILMLKLICLIMQQKQVSKMFHMLILQVLH